MKSFIILIIMGLMFSCTQKVEWVNQEEASVEAAIPTITIRFNNPQYDFVTNKLKLDVEFLSNTDSVVLFGANVRFFYDATVFSPANSANVKFVDFAVGYGTHSPNPPYLSTSPNAGIILFGLTTLPVSYVNGAFALNSITATPVYVRDSVWTKLFAVQLTYKTIPQGKQCPMVVWDKENPVDGSFLPGSDGVVITIVERVQGGEIYTDPAYTVGTYFNWTINPSRTKYKNWGVPNATNCFQL